MLREEGVKASHPSQAKLIDERERGRLLHFFANHELLATELMALVLLKFPEAPASFRRGVLDTLKEEQIHTRLYIHRMQQCGVEFGELPLSDYFWRSVSSMEDPLDYVTRLSLTFEQANLDYSKEYANIFTQVGDRATAKILNKIYQDEIDHVGFGLKWFRRWKADGKTDWEAFRGRLSFPLSPARAKGNHFNAEGRLDAGLDAGVRRRPATLPPIQGTHAEGALVQSRSRILRSGQRKQHGTDKCSASRSRIPARISFAPGRFISPCKAALS